MAVRKGFSANLFILAFCAAYSFFCSTNLLSQTRITGTVKEPSGLAVADLYVIASQPGSKILIAFSATNSNGEYTLNFTSAPDSIQIKTSRLDYAETSILVQNKNQHINLIVSPQATNLSEIVIRPEAVKRRGDTLNFLYRDLFLHKTEALEMLSENFQELRFCLPDRYNIRERQSMNLWSRVWI